MDELIIKKLASDFKSDKKNKQSKNSDYKIYSEYEVVIVDSNCIDEHTGNIYLSMDFEEIITLIDSGFVFYSDKGKHINNVL